MPQLIRYEQQVTPRNETTVVQQARRSFDEPGMGDALKIVAEVTGRIEEGRAKAEATRAVLATREALTKYERDLAEQDLFAGDMESLFDARAEEILKEQSDRIKSGSARKAFSLEAEQIRSEYRLRVDDMARKKSADEARSITVEVLDLYKTAAADPLSDPDEVRQRYADFESLLRQQEEVGIYGKAQSAELRIAAADAMQTYTHNRHVYDIDTMLETGRYADAKTAFRRADKAGEILPDKRDALEQRIEGVTVEVKSLEIVDPIAGQVRDGSMTEAQARAKVAEIGDPIQRKAARQELDYQLSAIASENEAERRKERQAREDEAEAASDLYSDWDVRIRAGAAVSQIPREQWQLMTPAMRSNLSGHEQKAPKEKTSLEAINQFYTLYQDPDKTPVDVINYLNQNADQFTAEDYKSFRAKAAGLKVERKPGAEDPRTLIQSISSTLDMNGIDDEAARGQLLYAYSQWEVDFQETYKRKPAAQERQEQLDRLVLRVRLPNVKGKPYAFQAVDLPDKKYGIPVATHEPVVARFFAGADKKYQYSRQQIKDTYAVAINLLEEQGIEDPNEVQLSAALSQAGILMARSAK
jgi:hypothetical protein